MRVCVWGVCVCVCGCVQYVCIRGVGSCFTVGGGAALKGRHLCILIAKQGTWVNILKISSILTTDAKIDHFIHVTEANKMANLKAIVNFGQNQKLQTFKWKFLPSLGVNLNNFVIIHT